MNDAEKGNGEKQREIGGYFSLETQNGSEYHSNAVRLNSAKNCLRYIIRAYGIKSLYVPRYTCPIVWDAVNMEQCEIKLYSIDKNLMPKEKFPKDSYILYTNYFGICSENIKTLSEKYPLLIVDNSQSFFSGKDGLASFNSARKFFGVPDGAYLFTDVILPDKFDKDISWERASHLLMRADLGAEAGYNEFKKNDHALCGEEIKTMSDLTQSILKGIDYEYAIKTRISNFRYLQEKLSSMNELEISLCDSDVPMCYPFLYKKNSIRARLIEKKIYVPTYWKGQCDNDIGNYFEQYLCPIPIDQRYNTEDMSFIAGQLLKILQKQ